MDNLATNEAMREYFMPIARELEEKVEQTGDIEIRRDAIVQLRRDMDTVYEWYERNKMEKSGEVRGTPTFKNLVFL